MPKSETPRFLALLASAAVALLVLSALAVRFVETRRTRVRDEFFAECARARASEDCQTLWRALQHEREIGAD